MTKEIGLIIKMPTKKASKKEIESRKSKFYKLLNRWAVETYLRDKNIEVDLKGVELPKDI